MTSDHITGLIVFLCVELLTDRVVSYGDRSETPA